ncbi:hypothetical protein LTR04_002945 [Oleoguttula sp. CCFEE 6159]|nr:hypothetical protein LTR04_002945 [Oleoguttula sp. CCFEE 6159]
MGSRLSQPRGPAGTTESSYPSRGSRRYNVNSRTIVAPAAALTMAALLFVYARTSIRAAKLNAQRHREADGGQVSWMNESRRRHGMVERIDKGGVVGELVGGVGAQLRGDGKRKGMEAEGTAEGERAAGGLSENEKVLKAARARKGAKVEEG